MAAFGRETWERSGEGVRGLVRPPRAAGAAPRGRWAHPVALAAHRARGRGTDAGDGRLRRGDARLRPLRRLQPNDAPGRTSWRTSSRRTSSSRPGSRRAARDGREPRRDPRCGAARRGRLPRRVRALARVRERARDRSSRTSSARSSRSRFVYVVAHYVSLFLVQGQFAAPAALGPARAGMGSLRDGGRHPEPVGDLAERDLVRPGTGRSPPGTWPGSRSRTIAR